jgi:hypothetical protein
MASTTVSSHPGSAAFDHHHAFFCSYDGDIQRAQQALVIRGVDHELIVDLADSHCTDGAAKGNVGKGQGRASGIDADDIGIVVFVCGQDQCDDLSLVAEIFGEHGTDGAVDLAAGENFTLAGPALALNKASGDAATCVGVLAIVHGQGEKIESFFGFWCCHCGGQNHVVTLGYDDGTRGLLGQAARFKSQSLTTGKLDCHFLFHKILISCMHKGRARVQRAGYFQRERQRAEMERADKRASARQPVPSRVHQPSRRPARSSLFA